MSFNPPKLAPPVGGVDFCQAFCEAHKCNHADFAKRVFWQCVYPHARWLARGVYFISPAFFEPDFAMIMAVGKACSLAEIRNEIDLHRYYTPASGVLRRRFKVRVSGQRLVNLASKVLGR
jgi:hypothetical protein